MDVHRRRIVAYIASSLVNPKRTGKIVDLPGMHESRVSGEVSPTLIAVFDHTRQDYVLGHRQPSNMVRLTDLACQHGIDLMVEDRRFNGLDHETGLGFSGEIQDHKVMFFDAAEQATYEYCV